MIYNIENRKNYNKYYLTRILLRIFLLLRSFSLDFNILFLIFQTDQDLCIYFSIQNPSVFKFISFIFRHIRSCLFGEYVTRQNFQSNFSYHVVKLMFSTSIICVRQIMYAYDLKNYLFCFYNKVDIKFILHISIMISNKLCINIWSQFTNFIKYYKVVNLSHNLLLKTKSEDFILKHFHSQHKSF